MLKTVLEKAGLSFLRAFAVSALFLSTGVLNAANYSDAKALAIAAVFASLAAGLRAVQEFIPQLTTGYAIADSFLRAFLATLSASLIGLFTAPDLAFSKSILLAVLIAAGTAGLRAVQGLFTNGEGPAPNFGV